MIGTVEDVPGVQGDIAAALFEALRGVIAPEYLSFGGGTVLAARWAHRLSLDVDLFCQPDAYARLDRDQRARLEAAIRQIQGCDSDVTWCEDIATYTEISGIEATVLPRPTAIAASPATTLPGCGLALQGSAQILYGKIAWRMYEGGEITVRDAYDVACARQLDANALESALEHVSPQAIDIVAGTISALPEGWTEDDENKLIEPLYTWSEAELQSEAAAALRSGGRTPQHTNAGPGR